MSKQLQIDQLIADDNSIGIAPRKLLKSIMLINISFLVWIDNIHAQFYLVQIFL